MITSVLQGGMYIFQLMDFYAASGMSLLWCVFFQTIAICWVFGAKKFYLCIEEMIGYRVSMYWYICWVLLAPAFMMVSLDLSVICCTYTFSFQFIFVFYFVKYTPITMGDYQYPPWGEALGFMISLSSMLWVPGTKYTFKQYLFINILLTSGYAIYFFSRPLALGEKFSLRASHQSSNLEQKLSAQTIKL